MHPTPFLSSEACRRIGVGGGGISARFNTYSTAAILSRRGCIYISNGSPRYARNGERCEREKKKINKERIKTKRGNPRKKFSHALARRGKTEIKGLNARPIN